MEKTEEVKKDYKRVLFLADFGCSTGFANVAHNIVAQLLKTQKYQIDVVGINYYGMPTEWNDLYPQIRLLPATVIANGDLFGRTGYLQMLSSGVYDLTFILQDTFQIEPIAEKIAEIRSDLKVNGKKSFKWIFYYPIDAEPKENWITKSPFLADYPVAYTQYGFNESVKKCPAIEKKLRIINHGTDIDTYKPLDKDLVARFKKEYFLGRAEDRFLITNVNRNQPRKDIPRTMQIFKLLKQQVPNALLYLHMKRQDVGHDIGEIARLFDLIPDKDYIVPKQFNEHDGVSPAIVNAIYNSSDVVMSTTFGEGWGLSITESMAVGTPVIAPNHTSLTEMIGEDRGTLVTAGKSPEDWVFLANDNERMRPVVNVAEYVQKLANIYLYPDEAKKKAENARKYVIDNWTWDKIGMKWIDLFEEALTVKPKVIVGRNDLCPCGSGKKYKNCHYLSE